jgi:DNA polymerase-3 subunit alpha
MTSYIEIQDHGLEFRNGFKDRSSHEQLVKLPQVAIKVVATNDMHYINRDDAPTQDIVSCIGTASHLDDVNRKHMGGLRVLPQDVRRRCASSSRGAPRACETTLEFASKCNNYELDWTTRTAQSSLVWRRGDTSEERFRKECEEGLAKALWRRLARPGPSAAST